MATELNKKLLADVGFGGAEVRSATTQDMIIAIVNIRIPTFAEDLKAQGTAVVNVDWKPPAGGDEEMLRILEQLGS